MSAAQPDPHASSAGPTVFSIVMPAYNAERTIRSAIESVLQQTQSEFELIVADDGSTDRTQSIVRSFADDGRISLISLQHGGPSAARNAAIAQAKGQFVCFLDSDDLWLPRYLEVMVAALRANPNAAVAYTDAWILYDTVKRIARGTAMGALQPPVVPDDPTEFLRALLVYGNFVYYAATVRREVVVDLEGFNEDLRGPEDYELWLRIAAGGYSFVRCDELLAVYRRREGQITADPATIDRALPKVFGLVAREYDVPDDLRALAARREREYADKVGATVGAAPARRSVPLVSGPHGVLARFRWFYRRPPLSVREAFPRLDDV